MGRMHFGFFNLRAIRIGAAPLFVILLALILILAGCGNVGGAGQCGGADDSGLCLAVTSIMPTDTINSLDTSDVDIVQNPDCDGNGTVEDYGAHSAKVTLDLSLVEGATSPPAADKVTITRYTVNYTVNPGSSGPVLVSEEYWENITVAEGASTEVTVELMDINKKSEYISSGGNTSAYPVYTVTYTFYGEDKNGNSISAGGYTTITVGNFDVCSS